MKVKKKKEIRLSIRKPRMGRTKPINGETFFNAWFLLNDYQKDQLKNEIIKDFNFKNDLSFFRIMSRGVGIQSREIKRRAIEEAFNRHRIFNVWDYQTKTEEQGNYSPCGLDSTNH
jgi:hypothetical protein